MSILEVPDNVHAFQSEKTPGRWSVEASDLRLSVFPPYIKFKGQTLERISTKRNEDYDITDVEYSNKNRDLTLVVFND